MNGGRSVGHQQFRHTMGHLSTGVTVVTVRDAASKAFGITVSAACSLSLEPPMLLVCIDHAASLHDLITRSEVFGLNVLACDQADVARRYADRGRHEFEAQAAHSPGGLPLVPGALAHIDVRREHVYPGGDHSIVTGIVEWSETHDRQPLCYFRSAFMRQAP